MLFSLTHLVPLAVAVYYADGMHYKFLVAFVTTFFAGLCLWIPVNNTQQEMRIRDGFLITALFWFVLGLFGALPFLLTELLHLSIAEAVFESVSGLTTTGATVIADLSQLPKSILFYRQQLQWLGGIGIVVIAVAILPMLGIGGMQLYRAETPGPIKDSKLTPRITETAKWLFIIYISLTVACAFSYWVAGMNEFDAIAHSFSTISIGGFSPHNASLGHYQSPTIWLIASGFMIISALNFALHFYVWRKLTIKQYLRDAEVKTLLFFLLMLIVFIIVGLWAYGVSDSLEHWWVHGIFQSISMLTTTGFATTTFHQWPMHLPIMLICASFIGGCAGSTGGGVKVIRVLLMIKQGVRELSMLIHPRAIMPVKIKNQVVSERVLSAVWSFLAVYVIVLLFLVIGLQATGLNMITAVSAAIAMLNNLGPGLGDVASHYGSIHDASKWIMCLAMLLGRLEIFTLLVLFSPAFWRR